MLLASNMPVLRTLVVSALLALDVALSSAGRAAADPPRENIVNLRPDLEALLMKGAFDDLETIANEYRASHARMKGGYWALSNFYQALVGFAGDTCGCGRDGSDIPFDAKRQAVEHWLEGRPHSLTATIALASLWAKYASVGRGAAYAQDTSADQWRDYRSRLAHGQDILATLDPKADPTIYILEIAAISLNADPRAKLDELYAKAIQAFPDFPGYAVARYENLQPRWYGAPGESQAFAQSLLTQPGGETGLIDYFDVAASFLQFERNYPVVFDKSGLSYPMLVKAFAARAASVGVTNYDLNVMMFYAVTAQDKKTAALLTKKIGDRWQTGVWSEKTYYDAAVSWTTEWP